MPRKGTVRRVVARWWVLTVLIVASCAKMGEPPGGAEDKSGPSVVSEYPELNSINVPRHLTARLKFSESVNRSSVEASLFLSPDPMQRLHYRWRGDQLELIYLDELDPDRTYVISVGSQAKDLRGNPAGKSFTIAFSTGAHIDRGRVEGWVTDTESPQGVSVWAYRLRGDTLPDPMSTQADYRMQPDDAGRIHLDYLRSGRYRIFGVTDKDHNNLWNPSSELIALPPWDVTVTDSTSAWVSFKLADQDTALPSLRTVKDFHPQEVELRTTAPVDTVSTVRFTHGSDTVGTVDQYKDLAEQDTWHVFPSRKLAVGEWTVSATGLSRFGESWASAESLAVRERADTTRPQVLDSQPPIKGRARTVLKSLRMEFGEPVVLDSTSSQGAILISPGRDTLRASIRQLSPRVVTVTADSSFVPGGYSLKFNGATIRDLSNNAFGDSTVDLRFGFFSPDSLGSLLVKFSGGTGKHLVSVFEVKDHLPVDKVWVASSGEARFSNLVPGRYTLEVAQIPPEDSTFFSGRMKPWRFSDPYFVPPDTISIRARWEQELNLSWPVPSP